MPISPENAKLYPKNWKLIRIEILRRAEWRCECRGDCGIDHSKEETINPATERCVEVHRMVGLFMSGFVILTIAHLNHSPRDNRRRNLKAMCQRCHNRYDSKHRQENAAKTRALKKG